MKGELMRKWFNNLRRVNKKSSLVSENEKLVDALKTSYKLEDKHSIAYRIGCQFENQHLSAHREAIEFYLLEGNFEEAKRTLLNIIDIVDQLSHFYKAPPAPWYYEQLSNIFQLNNDWDLEKDFLNRYIDLCCKYGEADSYLLKRYQEVCLPDDEDCEEWQWRKEFQTESEVP